MAINGESTLSVPTDSTVRLSRVPCSGILARAKFPPSQVEYSLGGLKLQEMHV